MKIIEPLVLSSLMAAGSLQAAVILTINDNTPLVNQPGDGTPTSGTGTIASDNGNPTNTYTWTGADFTSLGATETGGAGTGTITFTVFYSAGGTGSGITSANGKVSVTGGNNNRIEAGETLTSSIALTGISGYTGIDLSDLSIGFIYAELNNVTGTLDITGDFGSVATSTDATFATSSSFTLAPQSGSQAALQSYTIEITAVPEPSSAALLGLGGLALLMRRRR